MWSPDERLSPPPCGSPLAGDVKIRFPSADVARAIYTQQHQPERGNNSGPVHLKDITSKLAAIMVPNGVLKSKADTGNLTKAYMACNDFRGIDNLQLQARMIKTAFDLYKASLAEAGPSFLIPPELIGDITLALMHADSQNNEYVLLLRPSLLYILEYSRIYKVGDPTGPYACMEWPGIQIPQALITQLDDRSLLRPFSQEKYTYTTSIYFCDRNPAGKELDFDSNPNQKEPFMRYSVSIQL